MSVTYRVLDTIKVGGAAQFESDVNVTAGSDVRISEPLAAGATTIALTSDVSQLKVIAVEVEQTTTLVLKSSGTPTQTLTLTTAAPFKWLTGSGITNPLTADFDTIIATVAATGTIEIMKLEDPTV